MDLPGDSATLPPQPESDDFLRVQNARLAALHEVTLDLTSQLDLDVVLGRVVELAQTLSGSAHAHIFLYDAVHDRLELAASHWSAEQRVVPLRPRRNGITYTVARTGRPQFIQDTAASTAYAHMPPNLKPGALACLPLVKGDYVLGTLNLGYWAPHSFDPATRDFLDLIARHAAIAIENARLYRIGLETARLEHELEMARQLQVRLIPRHIPRLPGWDFAAFWAPARVVSGDFYDFVAIGDSPPPSRRAGRRARAAGVPGRYGVLIADVSDKGMPAALFMALSRSTLRASFSSECCPSDSISRSNRLLCADSVNGMFVTACYAQLDPVTGELVYVNAGHNAPFLYRAAQDEFTELEPTGMALGIVDGFPFEQRTLQLDPGDFILFYTDGVIDALDAHEVRFGSDLLREVLHRTRRASAKRIIAELERTICNFVGDTPPFDDITIVAAKRT